jgi:NhaA family Na+:H+ antiporter
MAAVRGGMIARPGATFFNHGGAGISGWGIPMATDIAFALGVLALLGDRVPVSLKVLLAALAIVDDIGAVLMIALFYTEQISWISLGVGGLFFVALVAVNRAGPRHLLVYGVLGIGLWVAILQSGIHATVAGVLLAFTIPAHRHRSDTESPMLRDRSNTDPASAASVAGVVLAVTIAARTRIACRAALESSGSPMLRLEHALLPWNKYVIMPLFALANAGVALGAGAARALVNTISLGIICGLVIGKPIGVVLFSWLAKRSGIAAMPDGISWYQIAAVGMLGGIGFTMSLFIADLAFATSPTLEIAKVGILAASVIAGIVGTIVLFTGTKPATGRSGSGRHEPFNTINLGKNMKTEE